METSRRSIILILILAALASVGLAAGLLGRFEATVRVTEDPATLEWASGRIEADAAPYETLVFTSKGLAEPSCLPGGGCIEAPPTAYKAFKILLESDKVNVTLRLTAQGTSGYNIAAYVTGVDVQGPALDAWGQAEKLDLDNGVAWVILSKENGAEYYIWVDGWVRTGESGTVTITVELEAEALP